MRSRWLVLAGAVAIVGGVVAHANTDLTQTALDTLTPIESTPGTSQLTAVFGGSGSAASSQAVQALAAIATDSSQDVGVQLRAIRDLGEYPNEPGAHDALSHMLVDPTSDARGAKVLLLRSAVEAFGALIGGGGAQPGDINVLLPAPPSSSLINHASQDIRAATARALGELCDSGAITPLRNQLGVESTPQVQFAISAALRVLGSCGSGSGS